MKNVIHIFAYQFAKLYYSPLYEDLGYNNFYGLGEYDGLFLNDNFWPMVIAQYGIIFLVLYISLVYRLLSNFFNKITFNQISSIIVIFSLISSTIGSSILTGPIGEAHLIFLTIIYNLNSSKISINEL